MLPLLVAALILPVWNAATPDLMVSTARVDLTPPLEMKASLGGYGERMNRPATGVHDRIWAKAVCLRQDGKRIVVVTADMLALPPGFKTAVIGELRKSDATWKEDQVLLLPSHSHTSIDMTAINPLNTFGIPQLGVFHKGLYERTRDRFANVISASASGEGLPCKVETRSIHLEGWNHNRRRDNVGIQQELTVTRIDGPTGPVAALVNWTAHPTFMDASDMLYSGDWPGHMQRTLEALIGNGVTAMYYNGAEGDQSPIARPDSGENWEKAERYGREIALQVWNVWKQATPKSGVQIESHLETLSLPERIWHPDFMSTGGKEYGLTPQGIRTIVETMVPTESHSLAVRIGDLIIAPVPGELASKPGDEIKERIRKATHARYVTIGGLADEWISYILPTPEYHRGGYEASMSFYGDGLVNAIVDGVSRGASTLH